jgi:hypothetical protein
MVRMALVVAVLSVVTIAGPAAAQPTAGPPKPNQLQSQFEALRDQLSRMTLDASRQQVPGRLESLELKLRVQELQIAELQAEAKRADQRAPVSLVLLLYAGFCALWARNSGRGPVAWFFLGLVFNVVAMGFLLFYNKKDREVEEAAVAARQR